MSGRMVVAVVLLLTSDRFPSSVVPTSVASGFGQTVIGNQAVTGIHRAAWLQGCWEHVTPARSVEESWTTAKGGVMIGVGRTIRDGQMTSHEMIVLREQGDRLAYEAHPSGQAPATFLSTRINESELVFENPAHDFPQEVGYRRDGDSLRAWTRGTVNGKERRIDFPYTRARCGGQ